ncbi:helix-turn-helix domain-containing protein [Tenacibaculum dicentrarchi]|uniref:helix-turn-helix domain-containing protein n=1 Tax=Tenacibaculum dicentrarchi TaxID=669041 RepID=UPI000C7AD911
MDKELIIREIIKGFNFKNDAKFAEHLGIKPQVLYNWKKRNTFDAELIYTKCIGINPVYLLTGKGEMLASEKAEKSEKAENNELQKEINELYKEKFILLKENSELQKKYVAILEENNVLQKKYLNLLEEKDLNENKKAS